MLVWGREATGLKSVVCVGPVAWGLAARAFGITLEVWAVVAGAELAFARVRSEGQACKNYVLRAAGAGSAFTGHHLHSCASSIPPQWSG